MVENFFIRLLLSLVFRDDLGDVRDDIQKTKAELFSGNNVEQFDNIFLIKHFTEEKFSIHFLKNTFLIIAFFLWLL